MPEQSIKRALAAYTYPSNDEATWASVKNMLGNFLYAQWKPGGLAGATPAEVFKVEIGLGTTMTNEDLQNGYLRLTVFAAVTHPAAFIIISIAQEMQGIES